MVRAAAPRSRTKPQKVQFLACRTSPCFWSEGAGVAVDFQREDEVAALGQLLSPGRGWIPYVMGDHYAVEAAARDVARGAEAAVAEYGGDCKDRDFVSTDSSGNAGIRAR